MSNFKYFIENNKDNEAFNHIVNETIKPFEHHIHDGIKNGLKSIMKLPGGITEEDTIAKIKDSYEDFFNGTMAWFAVSKVIKYTQSKNMPRTGKWYVGLNRLEHERNNTWKSFDVGNGNIGLMAKDILLDMDYEDGTGSISQNIAANTLYVIWY